MESLDNSSSFKPEYLAMEFLPEAYICVASVLALPDSHAKSTNAAKQDADVNEASCLLSLLFKTGGHAQLAIIHTTIRAVT